MAVGSTRNGLHYEGTGGTPQKIPVGLDNPLPVNQGSYILKVEEPTTTITYLGKAIAGNTTSAAVWQVKRIDTSVLAADILFADGNVAFDNIWDNRAALSYS